MNRYEQVKHTHAQQNKVLKFTYCQKKESFLKKSTRYGYRVLLKSSTKEFSLISGREVNKPC